MSNTIVEALLNKIDLVQLVSEYAELTEDSHGNYRACCCLHHGSNPTSMVLLDEKIVFCHSCGAVANAIEFYCEMEQLPFYAAVEALAEKYNISLENNQQYQQQKSIVAQNTRHMVSFQKQIDVVEQYLIEKRALTHEIIQEFNLGYCTDGSFLESHKNPNTKFPGIIFPIHDLYGRCVGFSKRRTDGNQKPTYVNSYDDSVFEKGSTLYNLNRARKRLKETKRLYVVEGYMDAISGHAQGLACVGYIGGYLVKGQLQLLKDIHKIMPYVEFVFAPDNPKIDPTGAKEVVRIREKLLKYAPELVSKSRFMAWPNSEQKDFNDLHKAGITIGTLPTEGVDKAVLRLELESCDNVEAEYSVVESFTRSIPNAMIKADIAKMLAERWDQSIQDVRQFMNVSEDAKSDLVLSEFATVGESIDKLLTTLDVESNGIGFEKIDYSLGGMQKKDVVLVGAYSKVGKCIHEDSIIKTESGHKKIKDIVVGDKVVTFNEQTNKLEYNDVVRTLYTGEKIGYKVTTKTRKSVIVSEDHPFLTPNGWIKIKDGLKVKDQIALPSYLPNNESEDISMSDVEFLALMIADGSCTTSSLKYSKGDKYLLDIMQRICKEHGTELRCYKGCNWNIIRSKSSGLNGILEKYEIMWKLSYEKHLPDAILKTSKEKQKRFIEILFSGDGWVEKDIVGYSSSSKELTEGICELLTYFGVHFYVSSKIPKFTYKGEKKSGRRNYSISIVSGEAERFLKIFTLSPGKNVKRFTWEKTIPYTVSPIKISREKTDIIMGHFKGRHKEINRIIKKPFSLASRSGVTPRNFTKKGLPQEKFRMLYEATGIEEIRTIASEDIVFDDITSIEEIGKVRMYDLEVSNSHNFVANGILVHNTDLLCEIILHSVMRLKMNCIMYSMEMQKEALIKRLMMKLFGVNAKVLKEMLKSPEGATYITKARDILEKHLYIVDSNNLSINDVKYRTEVANEKIFNKPVDRVFVDYFQYLKGTDDFEGIEKTAKSMKPFAKDLNCELYMLSQFSRADRPWDTPSIAAFKGGNSMESSFDKAILLWRPSKDPKLSEIDREAIKYQTMIRLESREEMYGPDTFEMVYNPVTCRLSEK